MSTYVSLAPSGLQDDQCAEQQASPVVDVQESSDLIEVNFIFPGFNLGVCEQQINGETLPFREAGISGAGFISESGKPLLPSFNRFVQIPAGCDYEVSIKTGKAMKVKDILITPAQENASDSIEVEDEFEYDDSAYQEQDLYPAEIVSVGSPQSMDGYQVLLLQVHPLQYNAADRLLMGYSNITVTIKLTEQANDSVDSALEVFDHSSNREAFGNLVLNPSRSINERVIVGRNHTVGVIKPRGPEYLIIYDNCLQTAATKLSNWKNRKGIITSTVSIKTVGNTSAKIKKYIRGRRRNFLSRLRYVLLLGDTNCITTEELSNRNTTDHYYFTSRDANNSNDCVMPWVSGGRIPVNNLSEANAVVEQIIRFEKNPPCDPHYYERMTFAAYFQDNNPQNGQANRAYMNTLENIRTHMVSLDFDIERIYVSNNPNPQLYKDGTAVPAEVRNAIVDDNEATERLLTETAEGQMLVAHRDHGNFSGWAHPSFKNNDLEAIRSAYPSIFYSINCSTGSFDKNADSFAETILTMRGGAPSLIAATELSGTWRNDSLMKGLFDALWPGVISTFPGTTSSYGVRFNRLGDVLNYAKSYLLVAHGSTSGVQDHFEIYHLVGDPTLQVWSEEPSRLGVRARIKKHQLNIHLCPAPADTVITLWYNNRQVKRMKVNSSRISVPLRDLGIRQSLVPSRRMLEVCVSSPGHRFSRIRVRV